MKYLYKYPQAAYPYDDLVATNRGRGKHEPEYELLDTGVFDGDRYFDVFVEYAKAAPEDVLVRFTVCNRGSEAASVHLLPTLWFRNTWSWADGGARPLLKAMPAKGHAVVQAHHNDPLFQESLADYHLYCDGDASLLFTENETDHARLFGGQNGVVGPGTIAVTCASPGPASRQPGRRRGAISSKIRGFAGAPDPRRGQAWGFPGTGPQV